MQSMIVSVRLIAEAQSVQHTRYDKLADQENADGDRYVDQRQREHFLARQQRQKGILTTGDGKQRLMCSFAGFRDESIVSRSKRGLAQWAECGESWRK